MRVTGWARRNPVELAWAAFAAANLGAMLVWPDWETIPFHFIWVSLTLVYGFRTWRPGATSAVLGVVVLSTGSLILADTFAEAQPWGELSEVPLMSAMFLAMVWHARRRQDALDAVRSQAEERATLLERQEQFFHDVSHELRTPVTIARGHLEVVRRSADSGSPQEVEVALDELQRIDRILERLLLLAKADRPDFLMPREIDLEPFLEEVFMRWSEIAPRVWRLGALADGTLLADPDALRIALDALLENAIKYSEPSGGIELSAHAQGRTIVIDVVDEGRGIPTAQLGRIFQRFARADAARTRASGGVGLGLAIVDAIAKAHGGTCAVRTSKAGSAFSLRLPNFRPAPATVVARAHVG
jgi:signal transduction histidine kinase